VRIAVVILVLTQLLNLVLVPALGIAGLSLSIGLGAMINAVLLLVGLVVRKSYRPAPGWGLFIVQIVAASALLCIYLLWAAQAFAWTDLRSESLKRAGLLAGLMAGAGVIYLGAIWASGLNLKQFLRR
jgi:putative peptidoglycan lipid II flippase